MQEAGLLAGRQTGRQASYHPKEYSPDMISYKYEDEPGLV
jgi:hypothetical protein